MNDNTRDIICLNIKHYDKPYIPPAPVCLPPAPCQKEEEGEKKEEGEKGGKGGKGGKGKGKKGKGKKGKKK